MGNEFDLAIFCETEILVQVRTDLPQYSPLIGPDGEYCGQVSWDWSAGHNTHL